MVSRNRNYQIMQGVMSLILGCFSIVLLITLRGSGYSAAILSTFLVVGIALIFSGDYLLNPFKLPVTPRKKTGIGKRHRSYRLRNVVFWHRYVKTSTTALVHRQFAGLLTTDLGATLLSRCRDCPDCCWYLWDL